MSSGRLLHVLGGGPWQVPTIRLAKQMGHRVLVTDYYADCPGYALADAHEQVSITDRDATLAVAARYRIDGILCDTTDTGVATAAYVAERLGLPGISAEAGATFTSKGRMRQRAAAAGVPVPTFRLVRADEDLRGAVDAIGYPLVVKPLDGQSGRGVSKVGTPTALSEAVALARRHTRAESILLEQFVAGTEVIVDSFVVDGAVRILGIARKTQYADNPTISERITYPAALAPTVLTAVEATNAKLLRAMGMSAGVTHAEYMVADERIVPIDVAARGGGVMIYTHVLPHLAGFNVNRAMIQMALGDSVCLPPDQGEPRAANVEFLRLPRGEIEAIVGTEAVLAMPGVAGLHLNVKPGALVGPLLEKEHRPGHIVVVGETLEQVLAISRAAKTRLRVTLAGQAEPVTPE